MSSGRWNALAIPKSITPSRIEENFQVFDFDLSAAEMEQIDGLNANKHQGPDPDEMNVF